MARLSVHRLAVTLALLVVGAGMLLRWPGTAQACSCVPPPPPQQALAEAAAVFAGTVRAIVPADAAGSALLVTFDVQQSWKGPQGPQITLATAASSASCGYEFVAGEAYLVYGVVQEGRISASLCSRTAALGSAVEDLAALGAGTPVPAGGPVTSANMDIPWLPLVVGGLALVIGVAILGGALARRR